MFYFAKRLMTAVGGIYALAVGGAHAQVDDGDRSENDVNITVGELKEGEVDADSLKIELNTPTTPAAAILGDDSISLSSLRSASDFFAQILSNVDGDGALQPGIAVGGSPYWWLRREETLQSYWDTPWPFLVLKRTQFGLATRSVPQNGENRTQVGVSLSWQLLRYQDPRFFSATDRSGSFIHEDEGLEPGCLANTAGKIVDAQFAPSDRAYRRAATSFLVERAGKSAEELQGSDIEVIRTMLEEWLGQHEEDAAAFDELYDRYYREESQKPSNAVNVAEYKAARDACRGQYSKYLQNRDSLVLTVATALTSTTGALDDFSEEKTSLLLSFKSGREGVMRSLGGLPVQAFAGYTFGEVVELQDGSMQTADRLTLGLGASRDTDDNSLDIQVSYVETDFHDPATPSSGDFRVTASYSQRLTKYIWLDLRAGTTTSDALKDATFAGVNIKVDTAALLGK